jgi:hypothetical protein
MGLLRFSKQDCAKRREKNFFRRKDLSKMISVDFLRFTPQIPF